MPLRDYQEQALDKLSAAWRSGSRSVLLVSPTGSGKTSMACEAVRKAVARGRRVLWMAHRRELIAQASERLALERVPHGVILAGHPQDPEAPVQVASVGSLPNRQKPPADLVVWDEAHHVACATWLDLRKPYPGAYHLGLTATPQRGDGRPLGDCFEAMVVAATVQELTARGFLVPCDVIAPEREILRSRTIAETPVSAYLAHSAGKRAVVYCATLNQANEFAQGFWQAGVPAAVVAGHTPTAEREHLLADIAGGALRAICNVAVLTEGWDAPLLETCILARKIGTQGLYLQCVGRVLRPAPGKERALLLDLGGSVYLHGRPDAERQFSLEGKGIELVKNEPLGVCAGCGFLLGEDGYPCPRCGYQPPSREVEVVKQGLALLGPNAPPAVREKHLKRLLEKAITNGYKPGYLWHQYQALFGAALDGATWRDIRRQLETSPVWREARAKREAAGKLAPADQGRSEAKGTRPPDRDP